MGVEGGGVVRNPSCEPSVGRLVRVGGSSLEGEEGRASLPDPRANWAQQTSASPKLIRSPHVTRQQWR